MDTWTVLSLEQQGVGPLNVKVVLVAYPETGSVRTATIWTTIATAPALGSQVRVVVVEAP